MTDAGRTLVSRLIVSAASAALAVVFTGCEGDPPAYPPELTFPPRDDRLVLRVPTDQQPLGPGEPGKLDAELAALDAAGGKTFDPTTAPPEQRDSLTRYLADTFGTPAAPTVNGNAELATRLGLTPERLAEGAKYFKRSCLQCHGLTGDGRGPSGQWIYPHPRDFRRGKFKFVTSGDGMKPRRADLARTLRDGLKGTAMPAFALLPEDRRERLIDYVIYLSLRGEVEFQTLAAIAAEQDGEIVLDGDPAGYAEAQLDAVLRQWERAEAAPPLPEPPTPDEASVRRGYELFVAKGVTDCATCHEDFGRKPTYRYDVWGTVVRPHDLTAGGYKGGADPRELFARIRHGIQPSGMPSHPTLTDEQVWDLVRFVEALPDPRNLPPDVRAKVYPE